MVATKENHHRNRQLLQIKQVGRRLVSVAAVGPGAVAIDAALASGDVSPLTGDRAKLTDRDHLALAIHDADQLVVKMHGHACGLVLHNDGTFNWVVEGSVRFHAPGVERLLLWVASEPSLEGRARLLELSRTLELRAFATRVREEIEPDATVLLGAQKRQTADEDEDMLAMLAEVAQIDHRATPEVVRRVVGPETVEPREAWRVDDGIYEAEAFRGPGACSFDLEVVVVVSGDTMPADTLEPLPRLVPEVGLMQVPTPPPLPMDDREAPDAVEEGYSARSFYLLCVVAAIAGAFTAMMVGGVALALRAL